MSSTVGVVEELRTAPDRWQFLLRLEDDRAVVVELRGEIQGMLRDGDTVELVDARSIHSGDVMVARRIANRTLRAPVRAQSPGWPARVRAFLMPPNIWTPLSGVGAGLLGFVLSGSGGDDASPPATATPGPSVTPSPGDPDAGVALGTPELLLIAVAIVLIGSVATFVLPSEGETRTRPARSPGPAPGWAKFAATIVAGTLVGVAIRLLVG